MKIMSDYYFFSVQSENTEKKMATGIEIIAHQLFLLMFITNQ